MLLEGGWVSTFFSGKSWGGVKKNPEISDDLKEPYNMKHLLFRTIHSSRPKHSYQPQRVKLAFKKNQSVTFFKTRGGLSLQPHCSILPKKKDVGPYLPNKFRLLWGGPLSATSDRPPPLSGVQKPVSRSKKEERVNSCSLGGRLPLRNGMCQTFPFSKFCGKRINP